MQVAGMKNVENRNGIKGEILAGAGCGQTTPGGEEIALDVSVEPGGIRIFGVMPEEIRGPNRGPEKKIDRGTGI